MKKYKILRCIVIGVILLSSFALPLIQSERAEASIIYISESPSYGGTIYSLTSDGTYIYAGGQTTNTIRKYLMSDMSFVSESPSFGGRPLVLINDGTYIYAGGQTTNTIRKYLMSTLDFISESPSYGGTIYSLTSDGTYIYAGGQTTNTIRKYLMSTLDFISESPSYGGQVKALTNDGTYIYAGGITTNTIRKYLMSDMSFIAESTSYGDSILSLTGDGTYIYDGGGGSTDNNTIKKYLASSMAYVSQSPPYGGVNTNIFALLNDGTYIYAGGSTTNTIRKYLMSDMSFVAESPSYGGAIFALSKNGLNYFAGGATTQKVRKYADVGIPTITTSSATSIGTTTARLNGNVTFTNGENPTVTLYWGTSDGGTTPASWSNNSSPTSPAQPQGVAAFYKDVTGLSPGVTYFFSASANNSGGISWATSLSFTTYLVVADVTGILANPSSTYIIISWQPTTNANSYVARYSTSTYPATPADGASAYSGTQTMATVSGLTGGQSYYFAIWGYNGTYSANGADVVSTTLAVTIPSGAQINPVPIIPPPTIPPNFIQTPVITQFNLQPFTGLIAYSNNATYGGLGMPINNLWETIFIIINVGGALLVYIKMKNFFVAYFVMVVISMIGVGIHLLQGYIVPAELIAGAGIWALERFFQ